MRASRAFVACGCISSTRLMLESIGRSPTVHRLVDSQYFVVPLVTPRAAPVGVATQGNTLAQVFLELVDRNVCAHTVHLQIYTFNDLMLAAIAARLPLSAGDARARAAAAAWTPAGGAGLPALL